MNIDSLFFFENIKLNSQFHIGPMYEEIFLNPY